MGVTLNFTSAQTPKTLILGNSKVIPNLKWCASMYIVHFSLQKKYIPKVERSGFPTLRIALEKLNNTTFSQMRQPQISDIGNSQGHSQYIMLWRFRDSYRFMSKKVWQPSRWTVPLKIASTVFSVQHIDKHDFQFHNQSCWIRNH